MNGLIIGGVIVNAVMSLILGTTMEYVGGLIVVMVIFLVISIFGIILIAAGSKKAGAVMVIIGSIIYIPIGLISMFGGIKVLRQFKEEEFERKMEQEKNIQQESGEKQEASQ